ncbi:MAG TPA: cytochrome c3 family protein, partial [Tianweitania sediminis]|nr:cytochrome c3 family protein [Tianweitania sediminis]
MAQIFTASADTRLRAVLFLAALGGVFLIVFGGGFAESTFLTAVGWFRDQPVPFSHQHHVGSLGIDCRYCHSGVETSDRATFPPTHTCMTCHSQIWTGAPILAPVRQSMLTGKPI